MNRIALLALALASPLIAQDTLRPIVVTATRLPTPVSTLASAVTVYDGESLRRAGITTVAEALRMVPGASLAQAGSYGAQTSFFLRGGESDYVRVLLDGVPINQAGGFLDLAHLTIENVERIEVVRGPASVLYGSDAVTGVVQVITRQPRRREASATARAGSLGTTGFSADVSGGDEWLGASAGIQRSSTDGVHPFNNGYDQTAASGRLAWRPDAATDVAVTGRWRTGTFHYPTDGSGNPADSNQLQRSGALMLSVEAGRRLSPALELRLQLGLHAQRDSVDDRQDHAGDTTDFAYFYESRSRTGRRSADLRAIVRPSGDWAVTTGVSLDREREDSRNSYQGAFGPGSGVTDVERTNRALYTQVTGGRGRLSVQAGARLDDNQRFGGFATWRGGASFRATAATRLRANLGTAFKEPTFIEHYSGGFSVGNPDLQPERSSSWEVGVEHRLSALNATVSATWFDQRFRDLIQYTFTPAPGDSANFYNVAAAEARGVELEARYVVGGFALSAQYTRLETSASDSGFDGMVFDQGRRLLRRPTHSGSLSAEWRASPALALGSRVLVVGARDDVDFGTFARVELAGYGRLDVWSDLGLVSRRGRAAALTLRIDNATGTSYQEVFGFRTPGRRVLVGLRVSVQ